MQDILDREMTFLMVNNSIGMILLAVSFIIFQLGNQLVKAIQGVVKKERSIQFIVNDFCFEPLSKGNYIAALF